MRLNIAVGDQSGVGMVRLLVLWFAWGFLGVESSHVSSQLLLIWISIHGSHFSGYTFIIIGFNLLPLLVDGGRGY